MNLLDPRREERQFVDKVFYEARLFEAEHAQMMGNLKDNAVEKIKWPLAAMGYCLEELMWKLEGRLGGTLLDPKDSYRPTSDF